MNCIIVHGVQFENPEGAFHPADQPWIPWIKGKLKERGVNVTIPRMPNHWDPKYSEWKEEFEKLIVSEDTVLIGFSAGAAFSVRWLGETNKRIKKLILVAPAKIWGQGYELLEDLCDFQINKEISKNIGETVIFVSNNESEGIKEAVKIYSKELNVKPIELKDKGHFIFKHMGTDEFPELLEEVLK